MGDETPILSAIRAAADGRREYAATSEGEIKKMLEHEAYAFDCVSHMIESGNLTAFIRAFTPSWRWKELGADLGGPTPEAGR